MFVVLFIYIILLSILPGLTGTSVRKMILINDFDVYAFSVSGAENISSGP